MKQMWSPQELDRFWLLSDEELTVCANARKRSRVGFALQLKFLDNEGRFPRHRGEIAATVVDFVASQLGIPTSTLNEYDWNGRGARRHRAELLATGTLDTRATTPAIVPVATGFEGLSKTVRSSFDADADRLEEPGDIEQLFKGDETIGLADGPDDEEVMDGLYDEPDTDEADEGLDGLL